MLVTFNVLDIMDKLVIITEFLLYISFSLLMGSLLTYMIPKNKLPLIEVPKKLLLVCIVLIPILSFFPLLETAILLSDRVGFTIALSNMIKTFEIGKAWQFTVIVSALLYILIYKHDRKSHPGLIKVALFFIFLLVIGLGYAGHASSISGFTGFVFHSIHFLAVIIWIGLLLVVSWFSKDVGNDLAFLSWYTPLAIICVIILSVAGFYTMEIDIQNYNNMNDTILNEYKNSWLVNYGQILLLKHLLIIPLLTYACVNGFILKAKVKKDPAFRALKWFRVESLFVLLVFAATALMGQGYPPHQVDLLIKTEGASPLFKAVYQGEITPEMSVVLNFSMASYLLLFISVIFLGLIVASALKKARVISILCGFSFIMSMYFALMLGVQ